MSIVFILIGALPATLLIISKFNLATPPQETESAPVRITSKARSSREDVRLAA